MGHLYASALRLFICFPLGARCQQLRAQSGGERARQHHHPVFATLGFAHDDDVAVKIHVFDAQTHPLHELHAGAIEQPCQQSGRAVQLGK